MKKAGGKNKKSTIDDLAIMVAKGFDSMDKKFEEVDKKFIEVGKELNEVKENVKATRWDILNIGDRFVTRHEFDRLLIRFNGLEEKVKNRR